MKFCFGGGIIDRDMNKQDLPPDFVDGKDLVEASPMPLPKPKFIEIICPKCEHISKVKSFEDKKGWECDSCGQAWEIDPGGNLTRHPLVVAGIDAEYDSPYLGWGRSRIK